MTDPKFTANFYLWLVHPSHMIGQVVHCAGTTDWGGRWGLISDLCFSCQAVHLAQGCVGPFQTCPEAVWLPSHMPKWLILVPHASEAILTNGTNPRQIFKSKTKVVITTLLLPPLPQHFFLRLWLLTLHTQYHLILIILRGRYYYTHFIDKKTYWERSNNLSKSHRW